MTAEEWASQIELEFLRPLSRWEWPRHDGSEGKLVCKPSSDEEIARRAKAAKVER